MAFQLALTGLWQVRARTLTATRLGSARGGPAMAHSTATNGFQAPRRALLHCTPNSMLKDAWAKMLREAGVDLAVYPDVKEEEYAAVQFFICWDPPKEIFSKLTSLKAVQLQGAGVETVINNPDIPTSVPLLRIADPLMGQRMAMWVLWAVLNTVRKGDIYYEAQRRREWAKNTENWNNRDNSTIHIGILGLGVMGRETADAFTALGFPVSAWTRNPRTHKGVK